METLFMSDNGRVLIPAELREKLGLKPKARIFVEVKDGSLVLTSAAHRSAQRRAFFADLMSSLNVPPGTSLADELIAERRKEALRENT
jgi:AbrB family looped-hinge helix DNA binding protein